MVAGVVAQSLAHHLRVPGIILLLGAGVVLGPDVVNIVRPAAMKDGLQQFVGFAVAIILFEGGMQMNLKRLSKQAVPIRRLVTIGALITAIGGALAAKLVMNWSWSLSVLFGTLVIVTGPTVITPLLRRLNIRHDTATILEAEGIFIDAVGATVAVVALEVSLVGTTTSAAVGVLDVLMRLGLGAAVGVASGAFLAFLIRWRGVVPDGLQNILSLAVAVASFQIANSIVHESGITAAIVAGMVISNTHSHAFEEIVEFKEQLTAFSIATLFVLLAADVRLDTVFAIAKPGFIVVGLLMFVVRPLTVLASTWGTDVTWKQKFFLSWLAPRGIVAAAVASLFAVTLNQNDVVGGTDMRALVFLVIATTVTVQGLTGGFVARQLDLVRRTNHGYLILGANPLARRVGKALMGAEPVVLVDSNAENCTLAKAEGLDVIYANGLEHRTMLRGQMASRRATLALTQNESVNLLYAKRVHEHFRKTKTFVALESEAEGVTAQMVEKLPAKVLFGGERPLKMWGDLVLSNSLSEERWELSASVDGVDLHGAPANAILPLVAHRGEKVFLLERLQSLQKRDLIVVLVRPEQRTSAHAWLRSAGFVPTDVVNEEAAS